MSKRIKQIYRSILKDMKNQNNQNILKYVYKSKLSEGIKRQP